MLEINLLTKLRGGMTIAELSAKSGVNTATISQLENNRRKATYRTLARLATALDVEVEVLAPFLDDGTERKKRAALKREEAKRAKKTSRQITAA